MSAHEFLGWQAFERREPFGFPWWNWVQSWLAFLVDRTRPRGKNDKVFPQDQFMYRPGEPLFLRTMKRRASTGESND